MKEIDKIFKKYDLIKDKHIYYDKEKKFNIITRAGILKIKNQENITVNFSDPVLLNNIIAIKATGYYPSTVHPMMYGTSREVFESFGEASPHNNSWPYPVAIAEKRAESRVILKMVLKEFDGEVMGQDELSTVEEVVLPDWDVTTASGETSSSPVVQDLITKHNK
jgi:hypothetical protein